MIDTILIFAGLVVISAGLFLAIQLYFQLHKESLKVRWKYMLILVSFFTIGYLSLLILNIYNQMALVSRLASLLFFFGAIFVYLTVKISSQMNSDLQRYAEDLEFLVEEKTHELRSAQVNLIQTSKMAALGEMAGGIAHEINTPLGIIQLNAEILINKMIKDFPEKEQYLKSLYTVEKTVQKISKIIKSLRTFSREEESLGGIVLNANTIIDDTLHLFYETCSHHGIKLSVEFDASPLLFRGNASEISQILVNLIGNSIDAVRSLPSPWIKIASHSDGAVVRVEITDSGSGVAREIYQKIFQPFFTTKEIGQGTGLGLSTSLGIAKRHRGDLYVDTDSANTRFVLKLPKETPSILAAAKK